MNTRIAKYLLAALIISMMFNTYYLYKVVVVERQVSDISFSESDAKMLQTKEEPPASQLVESLLRQNRTPQVPGTCGTNKCFCGANVEIRNYFWSDSYDKNLLKYCAGSATAEHMFTSPGSQNIPVFGQVGLYLADHNSAWLLEYFRVQRYSSGKNIGFMGKELFSTTYGPPVASSILLVHNKAIKIGDTAMIKETTDWLRTYWATYSLAAIATGIDQTRAYIEGKVVTSAGNSNYFTGYSAPLAGSRSTSVGNTRSSVYPMLAMALNIKPRSWLEKVTHNDSMRAVGKTAIAAGVPIGLDEFVSLNGVDAPASRFGLTEGERDSLRAFINSDGFVGLDNVIAMMPDHRSMVPITFYRTENGISTWIGSSEGITAGAGMNPNHPSTVFATTLENKVATYLHPSSDDAGGPGYSKTWRNGNKICVDARKAPPIQCIQLATGNVIYEVTWTPDQGMVRLQ